MILSIRVLYLASMSIPSLWEMPAGVLASWKPIGRKTG